MIETTVSEINVLELMERVRAEANRPRRSPTVPTAPPLPPVAMLPAAPNVWIPGPVKSNKERLDRAIETARGKNEGNLRLPKFFRRFFRRQGGYNRAVLEGIGALAKSNHELTRRVTDISVCLGQLNSWLLALHEQSDADANWMKAAAPAVSRIATLDGDLRRVAEELAAAWAGLEGIWRETAGGLEAKQNQLTERMETVASSAKEQIASLREGVEQMRHEVTKAAAAASGEQALAETAHLTEQTRDFRQELDHASVHLRNLQAHVDRQDGETVTLRHSFDQRMSEVANDAAFLKGELSEYGLLLRQLFAKEHKPGPSPKQPSRAGAIALDSFYFNFENRFRGARDEIKLRVRFYLPFIRKARAGSARRPVLDLGCGRGEWLELLRDHKLEGRGIDLNTTMIAHCKTHGLKVRLADAVDHLRSLRANSQGAVTGFHIIEHMPFEILMDLFGEARRVLQPGGVVIFESPNCKNLVVGACNFNIDPTHRDPVFPETAEFMLASHGFEKIRIEYLSPVANPNFEATNAALATVKDLLYGPQDFGIIGYKPKRR